MSPRPRLRRRARAFTLVELMVAMTAGLFVAVAAFAMARQGSRFFQQEARVANAQYAATLGFDRLRADIARVGFLSTPSIALDRRVCPRDRGASWPAEAGGLKTLAAVRLAQRAPAAAQNSDNGLFPDRIVLSGSYASAELFPAREIVPNGNQFDVVLAVDTPAMVRTTGGTMNLTSLQAVFAPGRGMRILDQAGDFEFGVIDSVAISPDGAPVVKLAAEPAIPFKSTKTDPCGVRSFERGAQVSVISWIVYELRSLASSPEYAPIYAAMGPGDEARLELVRYEQDVLGNEVAGSMELVAEYAVDLKFAFTVATNITAGPGDFALTDLVRNDFDAPQNVVGDPGQIRSVRARLAVRSREGDRSVDVPASAGNVYRYQLADGGFARVRTLTAEIQVPNLAGFAWR